MDESAYSCRNRMYAMNSIRIMPLLVIVLVLGMSGEGGAMELNSTAFANEGKMPIKSVMKAIGGQNLSPPFTWSEPPTGTRSFALSIIDPHPVAKNWVHWLVINIPSTTTALDEGASDSRMPTGTVELQNSFGLTGYGGPQPPKGTGDHPYVCTIYALDVAELTLPIKTSLDAFKRALEGHILAGATITGMYGQ